MKIIDVLCVPGRSGFFTDDAAAIAAGALHDGFPYAAEPLAIRIDNHTETLLPAHAQPPDIAHHPPSNRKAPRAQSASHGHLRAACLTAVIASAALTHPRRDTCSGGSHKAARTRRGLPGPASPPALARLRRRTATVTIYNCRLSPATITVE
jgi:hypothetical protein